MNRHQLKMGDLLSNGSKLLIVTEVNDGVLKKLTVVWNESCYVFEDTIPEKAQEEDYWIDIENDEYTLVGNLCSIHCGVLWE